MFTKRLKELRLEAGLTQKELAQKLNVAQNSYSNWENGNREPLFPTIEKLADILNTTPDYLLGNSNTKEATKPELFFRQAVSDMKLTKEQEEQFQKDIINFIEQRKKVFEEDSE
ncbi:helix-turn-helix domain-containing protein [Streptococcus ovis]|uniref:helix-turn-helix domain-containing protein n=1 Tax=Streptococcus ovis TaxID=82806 RepID=UPI00037D674E|nr:helix-turn-helix transcriptional regulator [Streptococcus ovis]